MKQQQDNSSTTNTQIIINSHGSKVGVTTTPLMVMNDLPSITSEELNIIYRLLEHNPISSVFDHFLTPYVSLERTNLNDMLEKLRLEEGQLNSDVGSNSKITGSVFSSSMSLFNFVKNSIKRCIALNAGIAFLNLSNEFKIILQKYAESHLKGKLPPIVGNPPTCKVCVL